MTKKKIPILVARDDPRSDLRSSITAKDLWEAGYRVTSRRYRMVSRIPPGLTGRGAMNTVDPGFSPTLSSESCAEQYRRVYSQDHLTLEWQTWQEFLAIHRMGPS